MSHRLAAADRRQQILTVAQHLFATHGFHATTARDIARAAGVSDALMYLYFRSKQEVFEAIIDEGMARMEEAPHRAIPRDLPVQSFFLQVGLAFMQRMLQEHELLVLLTSTYLVLPEDRRWAHFVDRLAQQSGHMLAARAAAGEVRADTDGYLVARQFFGDIISYVLLEEVVGMHQVHHVDPERYVTHEVDCLLHGILPQRQ